MFFFVLDKKISHSFFGVGIYGNLEVIGLGQAGIVTFESIHQCFIQIFSHADVDNLSGFIG